MPVLNGSFLGEIVRIGDASSRWLKARIQEKILSFSVGFAPSTTGLLGTCVGFSCITTENPSFNLTKKCFILHPLGVVCQGILTLLP